MTTPLDGLRVIDFTRVLAGPHCTKTLRDLGADVIKIEPPAGDIGRMGVPNVANMGLYFAQQNAGKRILSLDLNWPEARELVADLCSTADVICENFRPGTLGQFGLGYDDVVERNPNVIYVSMSGYGQTGPWKNRPAFAPTVQAEVGLTQIVEDHFGEALTELRNDPCSHADLYTGLHGAIAVLAALAQRNRTGEGQHVDVAMAATMLSVNERAGALLSGIDFEGEPLALSAPESPIFNLPGGLRLTIAASPVWTPIFGRYCAMMRRNDLKADPRFATPELRRKNLPALLAEVRSWLLTFSDLDELQAQVSEAGLAIGQVRSTAELAESEWAEDWGAIVEVDDRNGGTIRLPGPPWRFSNADYEPPSGPAWQGEHNEDILREAGVSDAAISELRDKGILVTRYEDRWS